MLTKQTIFKSMTLVTIILMDLLAGMEFDLFVPSFPELQAHFNLSPFWLEASLSANFIGYCLSLFVVGTLADQYGRKPTIIWGLIGFILGSLLCIFPPSYTFLLVGRFIQGVGIAAPSILSFLIIADSYPLKKQQYLIAMLNGVINLSIGIAPILGSYITLYFHWQGSFITLLLLGILTLIFTVIFIPSYPLPQYHQSFSWRNYISILQSKPLMLLIIHIIFLFVPYWIFVGMSPLLYMEDLGVSLVHFGYYQGFLAFMFALGSIFFGFIVGKYNPKNLLYVAQQIFVFGLLCLLLVTLFNSQNPLLITFAFLPFIIGQIIPSTILYPLCLNFMPEAKARVSAMIQGTRLIFSALSLQVVGYFYQGSFQNIGMMISVFIFLAVLTLFYVLRNRNLMDFLES